MIGGVRAALGSEQVRSMQRRERNGRRALVGHGCAGRLQCSDDATSPSTRRAAQFPRTYGTAPSRLEGDGFDEAVRRSVIKDRLSVMVARRSSTWLPTQYTEPSIWVDELVSNRALTLSHTEAHKELLNQHKFPDECQHRNLYEESLWCLCTPQDDVLQKDNSFMEEDRSEKIATYRG